MSDNRSTPDPKNQAGGRLERLQKIIANAGIASRRKAEELIADGQVKVNGHIAKIGDKADINRDTIKVGSRLLKKQKRAPIYVAFNKPKGVDCILETTSNAQHMKLKTMEPFLKKGRIHERVFPVAKIGIGMEGLTLLTNDGALQDKLQKDPNITQYFKVKVKGRPKKEAIDKLARPGRIEAQLIKPVSAKISKSQSAKSTIEIGFEGIKSIPVKQFFKNRGFLAERIIRTRIGDLFLNELPIGGVERIAGAGVPAGVPSTKSGSHRTKSSPETIDS